MKEYTPETAVSAVYGDLLSPLKQIDFTNIVKRYNGDAEYRVL